MGLTQKSKIKRQAISISIKELRELADKMENELKMLPFLENKKQGGLIRWSIPIINKTDESDTWEIEK